MDVRVSLPETVEYDDCFVACHNHFYYSAVGTGVKIYRISLDGTWKVIFDNPDSISGPNDILNMGDELFYRITTDDSTNYLQLSTGVLLDSMPEPDVRPPPSVPESELVHIEVLESFESTPGTYWIGVSSVTPPLVYLVRDCVLLGLISKDCCFPRYVYRDETYSTAYRFEFERFCGGFHFVFYSSRLFYRELRKVNPWAIIDRDEPLSFGSLKARGFQKASLGKGVVGMDVMMATDGFLYFLVWKDEQLFIRRVDPKTFVRR